MFVSRRKYTEAMKQAIHWKGLADAHLHRYDALVDRWNALVREINAKGGREFLDGSAPRSTRAAPQFTDDDIDTLIRLCHPDKHGGKDAASRMTQRLLELRRSR